MKRYALTLKPVLVAIVLGACSTTPDMPKDAWKIAPVQTVRHGGATAAGYFALGRVKEGQGASAQAIEAYRKAVAADPAHVAAWNALGALQMQLGRTDEGLQALEHAVSLAPKTSHLHNNFGYALLLAGRDDDAAKELRRAVDLDGSNRRAWANLATAYRRLGALDQAEFADARANGKWNIATNTTRPAADAPTPLPSATISPAQQISVAASTAAPATQTTAPAAAIAVGTIAAESSPAATPIAALQPHVSSTTETPPAEKPASTSLETSTAALGMMQVVPTIINAAAALMVTTTPQATIVKVAENVFELRNGPAPRGASVAEAAAIIAAVASAAAPLPARAIDAPASPQHSATATIAPATRSARYEISNGHGGEGLARRLAGLLGQQGVARPRLTNQTPFNQATSVIQYRDGYRASAEAFAALLPFQPELLPAAAGGLRVDVRLVLGRDLTTSDACAVLGLCTRVARTPAPKLAAAPGAPE
ncbi:LytR C-terminal domain-containing protein [Aromatoleum petrolei]|uniref:Tetratricopeptide repeat protein n=1 Tax=Aromatoleum petrolei TaxID=76116 RepID=A0ABX1MQH8_9RHOO|nr:LytR C-terminal domain-containing protein [Aromatoleum petrolei]NMF89440.1 tetratricopeptide repeat protein [Aromatoleum petrolei]QTQ36201.1 TPR-containing protein [Aromatoleum petrolei]